MLWGLSCSLLLVARPGAAAEMRWREGGWKTSEKGYERKCYHGEFFETLVNNFVGIGARRVGEKACVIRRARCLMRERLG